MKTITIGKTSYTTTRDDIFAHHARHHVEEDTDLLVNLTNDAWFRESPAQWQHFANAMFRAVENGVPFVRCANNCGFGNFWVANKCRFNFSC